VAAASTLCGICRYHSLSGSSGGSWWHREQLLGWQSTATVYSPGHVVGLCRSDLEVPGDMFQGRYAAAFSSFYQEAILCKLHKQITTIDGSILTSTLWHCWWAAAAFNYYWHCASCWTLWQHLIVTDTAALITAVSTVTVYSIHQR